MTITCLTYSYLTPRHVPAPCSPRHVSDDLERYLEQHLDSLVHNANSWRSPPAEFLNSEARKRFEVLETGSELEFMKTAQELLDRLTQKLDGRAKPGFFVAVRRELEHADSGAAVQAAVLKLDVIDKAAAAVGPGPDGEPTLEAVKDLLDAPGSLQKGALHPDPRPPAESELVVGDRQLTQAALYFLDAIDARQDADPGQATVETIRIVADVAPGKASRVAAELAATTKPVTPKEFFGAHKDVLDSAESAQVVDRLAQAVRPIREIDPGRHAVQQELTADGILVRARTDVFDRKVRMYPRPEGGWTVRIDVDEEPRQRYL